MHCMRNTVVLIVLDGWGIGQEDGANPIHAVHPKTITYIKEHFPSGALQASGIAVGLPWGEEGNSEVGHLTMGIGKVMYQYYPRISIAIKDGTFQKNPAISDAINAALQKKTKINFVGLVGTANVHASMEHLMELIALAKKSGVPYALHLFTDGRDSDPHSALSILATLPQEAIGSIGGRYYGMDRDQHWDLTQRAYQALVGDAPFIPRADIQKHIQETYDKKLNDEFILPVGIDDARKSIADGDSIFFFDFREDRMRQIAESFVNPAFDHFPLHHFPQSFIASMTLIREDFTIPVAFPPQNPGTSLGAIISQSGKSQLRIAETQKYAHVTFFFNGLTDAPFPNEYRVLIPSRAIPRQDEDPEMMAPAITTRLVQAIEEEAFDFILVNYANPDMVAHTGNYTAALRAVQIIDDQLTHVLQAAFKHHTTILITSDHGNIERMFNPLTGEPETKHDSSPVPVYLISENFFGIRDPRMVRENEHITIGLLSDVAPTILDLLHIPKPPSMSGESLLPQLLRN